MPRGANPYQELLYEPLRRAGVAVGYGATLTPSHTLNLLALPLELAVARLRGHRILHLHWVFGFSFPGSGRSEALRRLSRWWFVLILGFARLVGLRVVWTAHNVLPHERVFDDDVRARQSLVKRCDLVIAHTAYAIAGLTEIGARPSRDCVMPLGPMVSDDRFGDLPAPGSHPVRTVLFFGQVAPYKGVQELLMAIRDCAPDLDLIVAGACRSPEYARTLRRLAVQVGPRARLHLERVPEAGLGGLFAQADALVFPFRAITTSSSVLLGLASGRPVVIPDLPALAELPDDAVIRYRPGLAGLTAALEQIALVPAQTLIAKGASARAAALAPSWEELAARTAACFDRVLRHAGSPEAGAVDETKRP